MVYNIGMLVVRQLNGRNHWDMVGIIKSKRVIGDKTYYNIIWSNPKHHACSDRWQAHEFELVEKVKKV